jgi:hypothetical protein
MTESDTPIPQPGLVPSRSRSTEIVDAPQFPIGFVLNKPLRQAAAYKSTGSGDQDFHEDLLEWAERQLLRHTFAFGTVPFDEDFRNSANVLGSLP